MQDHLQPARLLVIPGLNDSGPAHWQSWLEGRFPASVRVRQRDWSQPDLLRWSCRIDSTIERADAQSGPARYIAAAHSFGVLALAEHLARRSDSPILAVLLVAPADPARFGLGEHLPQQALRCPATLVASTNDPWLSLPGATHWAACWNAALINLGAAGHINVASGHGPLPLAEHWVQLQLSRAATMAAQRPHAHLMTA